MRCVVGGGVAGGDGLPCGAGGRGFEPVAAVGAGEDGDGDAFRGEGGGGAEGVGGVSGIGGGGVFCGVRLAIAIGVGGGVEGTVRVEIVERFPVVRHAVEVAVRMGDEVGFE